MTEHPAKYSALIMAVLRDFCADAERVLDPFAGTGLIHQLDLPARTFGIELEPEWATIHPDTIVGNALDLPFPDGSFDCVATSPTYGNRMADHHNAKDDSKRITYRHKLGRPLHPENSGQLQWGERYREFHRVAWREVRRVLQPDGIFVLNVSNHIRSGNEMPVSEWHAQCLTTMGFRQMVDTLVRTPRSRFGANGQLRVEHEHVYKFRKVSP